MDLFLVHIMILILTSLLIVPCESFTCIHDKMKSKESPNVFSRSIKKYHEIIEEREKHDVLFEPLDVFFYFDIQEESFSANALYNIKWAVEKIQQFISATFQVRKRDRPYLLQRESCNKRWQFGKNRGKCAEISDEIEFCETPDDKFQIPDKFLDKLEVYDNDSTDPKHIIQPGSGLINSNFVAFVSAQPAQLCDESDVFAFAVDCRSDKETNEPLAGIMNLCPSYFKNKLYPQEHYYNILLHEIFHMLGFTKHDFERYLPCQRGVNCTIPRSIVQEDSNGTFRMMFPHVIKSMQMHFDCDADDFGGPMDKIDGADNSSEPEFSSHWHSLLMYSSIMTPKFTEKEDVYVDNITLATFASTGWYRINFDKHDKFDFGKGEGCNFGSTDSCNSTKFLCDPNSSAAGCDMLHKTISKCTVLTPHHPCGVYQPDVTEQECQGKNQDVGFGMEVHESEQHKCLLLQANETEPKATCVPVKCMKDASYKVLVNVTWTVCTKDSEKATAENYTVQCVNNDLFCKDFVELPPEEACPVANPYIFISVRIDFQLPEFDELREHDNFKNFKVSALKAIADKMDIPVNYLRNASMYLFKKTYLDFSVCPPASTDFSNFIDKLKKIQDFLDKNAFVEVIEGPKEMTALAAGGESIGLLPTFATSFSDYEGFRALLFFPVICAMFIIVTFISSLGRFLFILINKPKRTNEEVELDEIPS